MLVVVVAAAFIPTLRRLDDPVVPLEPEPGPGPLPVPGAETAELPAGRIASLYPTMPLNHPTPTSEPPKRP